MQKTADQSNKHTRETISVTYICIQLPTSNLGNDLVTELLPISAYFYPLQIEQFYANCLVSTSLSISFHIFRYFFIFLDQLHVKNRLITVQLRYERKDKEQRIDDSLVIFVLPSNFIMRNNKRVLTDSLRIVLRRPKRKQLW